MQQTLNEMYVLRWVWAAFPTTQLSIGSGALLKTNFTSTTNRTPSYAVQVYLDALEASVEEDPHLITRCLAERFRWITQYWQDVFTP